ncbi:hypothetical protein [Sphingomonas aerolata]|uniref:hypothetical protein n=1 Tax=Sphingomonas aerolata TaxID=185951 RepID=UPI0033627569
MRVCLSLALVAASFSVQARAQNNPKVEDFNATSFDECITGRDIGKLTGVSNPMLLLGSITYVGKVIKSDGTIGAGWVRQPLSLPVITSEDVSPDVATCSKKFEAAKTGSIGVLGLTLNADSTDVYSVTVRLITRQKLAMIPRGAISMQAWLSDTYRPNFQAVVNSTPKEVEDFFIFDNISVYLLEVQKFKRVNGGLTGAFGIFTGGISYKREEDFRGVRIIVTGDTVNLHRSNYAPDPVPVVAPPVVAGATQVLRTLAPAEATATLTRVTDAAKDAAPTLQNP